MKPIIVSAVNNTRMSLPLVSALIRAKIHCENFEKRCRVYPFPARHPQAKCIEEICGKSSSSWTKFSMIRPNSSNACGGKGGEECRAP